MHSVSESCDKSFVAAAKLIGDKWSLQIVHSLAQSETQRFNELQETVGGICPGTLSARLDQLEKSEIIVRQVFAEVPPRVEYRLTAKGIALLPVVKALKDWSSQHLETARVLDPAH